jgi:hypothetical protein
MVSGEWVAKRETADAKRETADVKRERARELHD